ncbi:MAG: SAM-dependent methyltransferase [Tannerella sp.]|jgi:hypothetical protein|nr:SAM-dependent methyltransferase [Tannerella sp.]
MDINNSLFSFIKEHQNADVVQLLLAANRYPDVDVRFAATQIAARQHIKDKLPLWYDNDRLLFPSLLAVEQCSSELTALYKSDLLDGEKFICDLTGGLGVDTYFFSQRTDNVLYVENDKPCFNTAMYNFGILQATNIEGHCGCAYSFIKQMPKTNMLYIDPSRRSNYRKRLFSLKDCCPNITVLLPQMLLLAPKIIAKLSPMLDLKHTLELLPETAEIHVIAVKNECKELLFVIKRGAAPDNPTIYCVNFISEMDRQVFVFGINDERQAQCEVNSRILSYIYEPNVAILKAGGFKLIAQQYGVAKLHINSHLYTSDEILPAFPGRIFRVERVYRFNTATCRQIRKDIPKANLTARNFPLTVNDLRHRISVLEGGDDYIFATTTDADGKILIHCRKI